MPTIHDLSKDILEIIPWHNFILAEIVVKHISADGQITVVEVVHSTPTLAPELLSSQHQRMEVAQSEQTGFELILPFGVAFVEEALVETRICSTEVGFQILGSFI